MPPDKKRRLRARQRRELERMNHSRSSLRIFLGAKSEEAAEAICLESQQEGALKNFWRIPSYSALDFRGVDIVCQTSRGYFLLNVKKSAIGVLKFQRRREELKENNIPLLPIYPWKVNLDLGNLAEKALESILRGDPSFIELPEDIRQELINPTYSRKKEEPEKEEPEKEETEKERIIPEESLADLKDKFSKLG